MSTMVLRESGRSARSEQSTFLRHMTYGTVDSWPEFRHNEIIPEFVHAPAATGPWGNWLNLRSPESPVWSERRNNITSPFRRAGIVTYWSPEHKEILATVDRESATEVRHWRLGKDRISLRTARRSSPAGAPGEDDEEDRGGGEDDLHLSWEEREGWVWVKHESSLLSVRSTSEKSHNNWDGDPRTHASVFPVYDRASGAELFSLYSAVSPLSLTPGLIIYRGSDDLSRHCMHGSHFMKVCSLSIGINNIWNINYLINSSKRYFQCQTNI
jgi:hypothetical protein